ncbi:MAG: hypothetical protein AB7I27_00530 [Bacteriovoracaceae bacterium]
MTDTYREACEKIYIENIQLKSELEKYRKAVEVYKESNDFYSSTTGWDNGKKTMKASYDIARQTEAKVKEILNHNTGEMYE